MRISISVSASRMTGGPATGQRTGSVCLDIGHHHAAVYLWPAEHDDRPQLRAVYRWSALVPAGSVSPRQPEVCRPPSGTTHASRSVAYTLRNPRPGEARTQRTSRP